MTAVNASPTGVTAAAVARAGAGRAWEPADGATARGTVVMLPGRGEHAAVYERFGRRLAFDGYTVRALDDPAAVGVTGGPLAGLYTDAATPLVLAGSDAGAARALVIAAAGVVTIHGLLLAGTLTGIPERGPAEWSDELDARTACPAHRARLARDTRLVRGSLSRGVPVEILDALDRFEPGRVTVPTLLVHGAADVIAPPGPVRALAAVLPRGEIAIVRDGRHDVLNDTGHRTAAAQVVQWLERLRDDRATAAPILAIS